ncbi:MAG: bifunctional [glutamine synthetase] adenylyltransferase/[glutamine synthetase]-adenylyl-L-tyrosine phosphorylase [Acidimicrobiales bacterium]|nr:bifunctional [glutamine synthetase] adenylyltransferase/[glutamine synthetase]-adenylyl-L-tyrosine phosphorylase [Acidimicrobiales bacterium]
MDRVDLQEAIERSAAPAQVEVGLDRLGATHPGLAKHLSDEPALRDAVIAVLAASRSLTLVLETDPHALDVLAALDEREPPDAVDRPTLQRWKRRELLRIAARDLLGTDPLEVTAAALAALARDVLGGACALADAGALAVIGMGKLGGSELNYASDVDVMFVGPETDPTVLEKRARLVMDITRDSFRIDANLRPQGRDGPLVRSLASYRAYWERWAETWEHQALLKARPVAGDPALGLAFDDAARTRLWQRAFSADDLRSLRAMKARAEELVARKGLTEREVKLGRGGIRDIEFAVQLLQLVHGRQDENLRSPTTLEALGELADGGYVDPDDADDLAGAYRFMRLVEHRLQLVEEHQVHALPSDPAAVDHLARVLGYRDGADGSASQQLDEALRRNRAVARSLHERLYFRPLLEAFSGTEGILSAEAAATRLHAFGFTDALRTKAAVRELTRGLTRSSRLMQQLLPLLFEWLSDTPDPDLGLLCLRNLASGAQRSMELATAFRESPEAARRLCLMVGTSRLLADILQHNPELIGGLADPEQLRPRTADELLDEARTALAWRSDREQRHAGLKRWKDRELLRIAARDLLGLAGVAEVGAELSALAQATLEAALESLEPPLPFAVVAMGRFGGAELSYASDLDVLFVYDGESAADFAEAERVATGLLRFVGGSTPVGRIFELDADLRPEGRQGPLARSLDGFRAYFDRWALVWERQAMIRARPVAGDPAVGQALLDVVGPHLWGQPISEADVREIRRIKARVERERIPLAEDPQFHLKLGKGSLSDVEFTAQLLQLGSGVPAPGTMVALDRLAEAGVLDPLDRDVLGEAYRFCERTRNRLFLVQSSPGDSLPSQADRLRRLARSLGTTAPELREDYRRVTRRARRVVERVFYGRA